MFADRNPTLDDYNDTVQSLYDDIERIRNRSLNEVIFELLKVECHENKASTRPSYLNPSRA